MMLKNKKADLPILLMAILITALALFTLFSFAVKKGSIDTIAVNTQGTQILYSREKQLQSQLAEITEPIAISIYEKVMNQQIFFSENGKIIEEVTDEVLSYEFKKQFKTLLIKKLEEEMLKQNELSKEFEQIKEILKNEKSLAFDSETIVINLEGLKITAVNKEEGREIFRGIYNSNLEIKVNLSRSGLSKASYSYFQKMYESCSKELNCISQQLPQFLIVAEKENAFKPRPSPPIKLQESQPQYDYEITYLRFTTKRKFPLETIRPVNFKVAVDVKELAP